MWDVFISHAWEDKETIARPLAHALLKAGLKVWYDEFTLKLGDNLRRSIDHGLSQSRYGVVILSPYFFAKEWPQYELDGLVAREANSKKVILPIWHNVTKDDVERFSPSLAGRISISTTDGLKFVVKEIMRVVSPQDSDNYDLREIPTEIISKNINDVIHCIESDFRIIKDKKEMIGETMQNLNLTELLKLLRRGETKDLYAHRLGHYVRLSPTTMDMVIRMKDYYSILEFKKEAEKFLDKHKIHGIQFDDKSYIKLILDDLKQLKGGLSLRSPEIWVDYILFLSRQLQNMDAKTWERKMFCCIVASILSHLLPPEISVNMLPNFPPPHSSLEEQYRYYNGIAREYYFNLTEVYLSHGENKLAFQSFNSLEPLWWDSFGFLILKGRIEMLRCNMRNPGKFNDLMNIFERALHISKGVEKIVALFYIGLAYYRRGDFRETENTWKQCLKLEHTLERKIILYHNLADVYRLSGNFENAKKLYEKSIGLVEALEEKEEFRFESLIGLSKVLIDLCLWEEAEEKLRKVIPNCTEKGFFLLSSLAKANLGVLMGRKGEYEEALEYYIVALDLIDKKYNSREYSTIIANLGDTLRHLRRTDEALIALEEALESARNESLVLTQSIEIKLADLFIDIGNFDESWELAQTVLGDSWLDNHRSEAEARRIQGKILLHEKKFQDAKNSLEESERILRELNLKYELLEVLELLEMCYRNLKDLDKEIYYRKKRKTLIQQIKLV